MSPITVVVLVATLMATTALAIYIWIVMPRQVGAMLQESVSAFSKAIELRCPEQGGMTPEVARLADLVAEQVGLSKRERMNLQIATNLRDIGLCEIPYALLNRKGRIDWTEAERATYDRHPEVSGAMLELIPSLRHLSPIVRSHHAHFDGSADPFLPSGDAIPVEARILAVCCDYVRETARGNPSDALIAVSHGAGSRYDPRIVRSLKMVLTSPSVAAIQEPAWDS